MPELRLATRLRPAPAAETHELPARGFTGARLLGVGLAAGLSAVTVALWMTGRLGLYINPESTWFAVSMAIIALVGCAVSFALPRGAEDDHGHDHGHAAPNRRPVVTMTTVRVTITTTPTTTTTTAPPPGSGGPRRR